MIEGSPDRAAMEEAAKGFGLRIEWEGPADEIDVYPDHWVPMQVAQAMGTQWNMAPNGRVIGFRYEALPVVMQLLEVPRKDRPEVFETLRVLESEMVAFLRNKAS